MNGWRCWVCHRCKIVSYHHVPGSLCPTCPNLMEFESGPSEELVKRFPSSKPTDEYTPYEYMGHVYEAFKAKQVWAFDDHVRPEGPPVPTDTKERQRKWFKERFPNL